MQIEITNDDGPPNATVSPFISSFVTELELANRHNIHVVLPDVQRSWIAKAHFPGQIITTSPYLGSNTKNPWILVNGSPACCIQLGISHLVSQIDLVVAGPNLGCNISSVFALSSGTIGAALEGAFLQRKAIALSYELRKPPPEGTIEEANRLSVRIIQWLLENWDDEVAVYNINIPLRVGISQQKIYWTRVMDNFWSTDGEGGAYVERVAKPEVTDDTDKISLDLAVSDGTEQLPAQVSNEHKHSATHSRSFDWKATHGKGLWNDVHVEGSDAWAIKNGCTRFVVSPHISCDKSTTRADHHLLASLH